MISKNAIPLTWQQQVLDMSETVVIVSAGVGAGKTTCGHLLARRALEQGWSVCWIEAKPHYGSTQLQREWDEKSRFKVVYEYNDPYALNYQIPARSICIADNAHNLSEGTANILLERAERVFFLGTPQPYRVAPNTPHWFSDYYYRAKAKSQKGRWSSLCVASDANEALPASFFAYIRDMSSPAKRLLLSGVPVKSRLSTPDNVRKRKGILRKNILYSGKRCTLACDGKCEKAWGVERPKLYHTADDRWLPLTLQESSNAELVPDPDDMCLLSDNELGIAPVSNGRWEGGEGKPVLPTDRLNKWCARQCERSVIVDLDANIILPNFSKRRYNLPPYTREEQHS